MNDSNTPYIDELADQLPIHEVDPNSPRMPFPTDYVLTREQEDRLVERALKRVEEMEAELGRDQISYTPGGTHWWAQTRAAGYDGVRPETTFMGKRQLFEMIYHNQMEWREHLEGTLFQESNLIFPITRRICRQMIARATNYFFGTDPWMAAYPVGVSDRKVSAKVDKFATLKFDQSGLKHVLETGVEGSFVRGEAIVKTTHVVNESFYDEKANVLTMNGQPVLGADQDFITDRDLWVPERIPAVDPATGAPAVDPATNEPVMQDTGEMVLKRDGVTKNPGGEFLPRVLKRRLVHYQGPESAVVNFKDFLCPLDVDDIEKADACAHLYDMPVSTLANLYRINNLLDVSDEVRREQTQKAVRLIRGMQSGNGAPESGARAPKSELREGQLNVGSNLNPMAQIAEVHIEFDANGDGISERVMLVLDRTNRAPVFYNYIERVTPDGKRPFRTICPNPVEGRWYGIGCIEMFQSTQEAVDLLFNRMNLVQSQAGRVDLWRPYNTLEGDTQTDLKLNWGQTYTPKANMTDADVLSSVYLRDIKSDDLRGLMEVLVQAAMNESGVSNTNDANLSGLDQTKLATGIKNIEKSGQEMFSFYLSHLEPGLQKTVTLSLYWLFAFMDKKEVFTVFEGNDTKELELSPEEVHGLDFNVQLLLTRYRGEQLLQSNLQASGIVTQFYSLPFEVQIRVVPMYQDMLRALQIQNPDELIIPLQLMQPMGAANSPTGPALDAKPQGKVEPNL